VGLYSITTRATGTTLTADIFNSDHQNHVTHTEPESINSYEPDVTTMGLQTNPFLSDGSVSLPASTADELRRIRYVLTKLKGAINAGTDPAFWYVPVSGASAFISFPAVGCRREQAHAQAIQGNGDVVRIGFDTTIYDTVGTLAHGLGILVPVTGLYAVGCTAGFGDGATTGPAGDFTLSLAMLVPAGVATAYAPAGVTNLAQNEIDTGATQAPKALTAEATAKIPAGSVVQAYVSQTSGTTKNFISQADARPAIWLALVAT
jgi:hypothetical protein